MGAHESAWDADVVYSIPQLSVPDGGFTAGSLADYFGIPTYTGSGESVNVLPFRAYRKIWNDWFRDQNLMDEVMLNIGDDGDTSPDEKYDLWDLLPVCKLHDYFTTLTPEPQRGEDVTLPLLGDAPVFTGLMNTEFFNSTNVTSLQWVGDQDASVGQMTSVPLYAEPAGTLGSYGHVRFSGTVVGDEDAGYKSGNLAPANLWASLDGAALTTVTELRTAFAIQRMLERDARGGTRYTEVLRSHFGVVSPDARLQRSEYLGGKRVPINVQDVTQTSAMMWDNDGPLGTQGSFSKTVDASGSFTRSFTEHGYLIGVACIRTDRTYQQGLNRMWSRKERFDFYWPSFVGVGDQPVYNRELYWQDSDASGVVNDGVVGYQERYGEYRFYPSMVTGAFRSNFPNGSLDSWHYADNYATPPVLSEDWIIEPKSNIDRTIAVNSEGHNAYSDQQFICDFYINKYCTRPMPVYSIPGMNDRF